MPDQSKPFQIEADASKFSQEQFLHKQNSDCHPVAFILRTLTLTERNYEIYDQELLSIIRALEEWQHYIQGSAFTAKVPLDHKNLTYFRKAQKLNRQQAWWSLNLSEYDPKLTHS